MPLAGQHIAGRRMLDGRHGIGVSLVGTRSAAGLALGRLFGCGLAGAFMILAASPSAADAGAAPPVASEPGFKRIHRDGISLEIAPLSREQALAFIQGRGFTAANAELAIERGCIHRSAIGNAGTAPGDPEVGIPLAAWRVIVEGGAGSARPPLLREDWDRFWSERGVEEAPAVAFHWALFPSDQVFAPTDHNWGFITPGLAPGTRFALEVVWTRGIETLRQRIEGLECAK